MKNVDESTRSNIFWYSKIELIFKECLTTA